MKMISWCLFCKNGGVGNMQPYCLDNKTHTQTHHYIPRWFIFHGSECTFLPLVQQPHGEQCPIKLGGSGSQHTSFHVFRTHRALNFPPAPASFCKHVSLWPRTLWADKLGFPRPPRLLEDEVTVAPEQLPNRCGVCWRKCWFTCWEKQQTLYGEKEL